MYNPQLKTFLQVADAGSFNKAAEQLYITSSAVVKQINLLEESLGLKLFERTHRGLILTEAGKSLYRDTKYIIGYLPPASQEMGIRTNLTLFGDRLYASRDGEYTHSHSNFH